MQAGDDAASDDTADAAAPACRRCRDVPELDFRIRMAYQPIVDLAAQSVFAYEALPYEAVAPFAAIAIVLLLATPGQRQPLGALVGGMSYPLYLNHWIGVYVANALLGRFGLRDSPVRQVVATLLALLYAFYSCKLAWQSHEFHDISTSSDATPLWIPQVAMAVGTVILAIAFIDELVLELLGRRAQAASGEALRNE